MPILAILKTMALFGAPLRKALWAVACFQCSLAATGEPKHIRIRNALRTGQQKHAKAIFSETAMLSFGMLRADRQGLYQDVLKKHWPDFVKKSFVAWLNFLSCSHQFQ